MSAHTIHKYQLYPFWDDEYKTIHYVNESFNDTALVQQWTMTGYANKFTGDMCDMRSPQPSWNQRFLEIFAGQGWQDIVTYSW